VVQGKGSFRRAGQYLAHDLLHGPNLLLHVFRKECIVTHAATLLSDGLDNLCWNR
jgi:hypothetical protein